MTFIYSFVKYFSGTIEWRGEKFRCYPVTNNRELTVDGGLVSDSGSIDAS